MLFRFVSTTRTCLSSLRPTAMSRVGRNALPPCCCRCLQTLWFCVHCRIHSLICEPENVGFVVFPSSISVGIYPRSGEHSCWLAVHLSVGFEAKSCSKLPFSENR